jgi:hypothetical protein
MNHRSRVVSRKLPGRACLIEALEQRQLLSMSYDLRLPGGGNQVIVTDVGQVVNAEVWVTITGTNSTGTDEGVQDIGGGFLSTNVHGGAALGDLQATVLAPFNASGFRNGAQADLDSDGDLDVKALDSDVTGFFARSGSMTRTGGELGTNSQAFHVADITFTVTGLLSGFNNYTELRFLPRTNALNGVWLEDNLAKSNFGGDPQHPSSGTVTLGSTIILRRPVATIYGQVYNDLNGDGRRQSTTETGLGGWLVWVDLNNSRKVDRGEPNQRTDRRGSYVFNGLSAGTYHLRIGQQTGWRGTEPSRAVWDVTLPAGALARKNFGETTNALIAGSVFGDTNGNGTRDEGETPTSGWQVFADMDNDGSFGGSDVGVLTDTNGNFAIGSLPAGSYHIRASASGFAITTPASGVYDLTLSSAQIVRNLLFGEQAIT